MAGHAQLKFVMTECSKTQIRLTGSNASNMTIKIILNYYQHDIDNDDLFQSHGIYVFWHSCLSSVYKEYKWQLFSKIKHYKPMVDITNLPSKVIGHLP